MKAFQFVSIGLFVGVVGFISYSLIKDAQRKYFVVTRADPAVIEEKLHLSGFVYPSKEIEIKPQLSGVVDELYVTVGDVVTEGAPIASVSLVPNSSEVENLKSTVRIATINLNMAKANYERQNYLYEKKAILCRNRGDPARDRLRIGAEVGETYRKFILQTCARFAGAGFFEKDRSSVRLHTGDSFSIIEYG